MCEHYWPDRRKIALHTTETLGMIWQNASTDMHRVDFLRTVEDCFTVGNVYWGSNYGPVSDHWLLLSFTFINTSNNLNNQHHTLVYRKRYVKLSYNGTSWQANESYMPATMKSGLMFGHFANIFFHLLDVIHFICFSHSVKKILQYVKEGYHDPRNKLRDH